MQIKRVITAEGKDGVAIQTDTEGRPAAGTRRDEH